MSIKNYIRERFFPHIWCPGCGHGIVLNNMLRAIEELGVSKNDRTTPVGSKAKQDDPSLIERGVFVEQPEVPEYCSAYERTVELAHKG